VYLIKKQTDQREDDAEEGDIAQRERFWRCRMIKITRIFVFDKTHEDFSSEILECQQCASIQKDYRHTLA